MDEGIGLDQPLECGAGSSGKDRSGNGTFEPVADQNTTARDPWDPANEDAYARAYPMLVAAAEHVDLGSIGPAEQVLKLLDHLASMTSCEIPREDQLLHVVRFVSEATRVRSSTSKGENAQQDSEPESKTGFSDGSVDDGASCDGSADRDGHPLGCEDRSGNAAGDEGESAADRETTERGRSDHAREDPYSRIFPVLAAAAAQITLGSTDPASLFGALLKRLSSVKGNGNAPADLELHVHRFICEARSSGIWLEVATHDCEGRPSGGEERPGNVAGATEEPAAQRETTDRAQSDHASEDPYYRIFPVLAAAAAQIALSSTDRAMLFRALLKRLSSTNGDENAPDDLELHVHRFICEARSCGVWLEVAIHGHEQGRTDGSQAAGSGYGAAVDQLIAVLDSIEAADAGGGGAVALALSEYLRTSLTNVDSPDAMKREIGRFCRQLESTGGSKAAVPEQGRRTFHRWFSAACGILGAVGLIALLLFPVRVADKSDSAQHAAAYMPSSPQSYAEEAPQVVEAVDAPTSSWRAVTECLTEEIRINRMRLRLGSKGGDDFVKFANGVADYNARCGDPWRPSKHVGALE
ncbi:MAG: hypothetical protein FWD68_13825 [Alphaproteobacteria bacterium]|nr:hypothetical protein [Alphaproteobacteria bacterium]